MTNEMKWIPILQRPDIIEQPGRQFIRLEGLRYHSGAYWKRVWCGEAFVRRPGTEGEMFQYRESDIRRLVEDGDMDIETVEITHWMPAVFPFLSDPDRR